MRDEIRALVRAVSDGDRRAIRQLADALQAATQDERDEFVESGAGETLTMGWTSTGRRESALTPIDRALAGRG